MHITCLLENLKARDSFRDTAIMRGIY